MNNLQNEWPIFETDESLFNLAKYFFKRDSKNFFSLINKLQENYTTFYWPEQFQLWSMNNTDVLVKDTEDSVKYIIKDYILDFNRDQSYYTKPKVGSLTNLVKQKEIVMFMNDDMTYTKEFPTPDSEYINQSNTFAEMM